MLMTVHQISCNTCDALSPVYDGAIYRPREARAELRALGWKRCISSHYGLQGDRCPSCAAKAARKKAK